MRPWRLRASQRGRSDYGERAQATSVLPWSSRMARAWSHASNVRAVQSPYSGANTSRCVIVGGRAITHSTPKPALQNTLTHHIW